MNTLSQPQSLTTDAALVAGNGVPQDGLLGNLAGSASASAGPNSFSSTEVQGTWGFVLETGHAAPLGKARYGSLRVAVEAQLKRMKVAEGLPSDESFLFTQPRQTVDLVARRLGFTIKGCKEDGGTRIWRLS